MTLYIQEFPDDVRWKLKIRAMETGVTLRNLVIDVLRGWCDGPGGIAGVKRASDVRGVRAGVSDGARQGRAVAERVAEAGGASGGAPAGPGAVDGGIRKDQGDDAKKTEGDDW